MKLLEKKNIVPLLSGLLLAALFVIALTRIIQQAHVATDQVIAEHIEMLTPIFQRINNTCGIVEFEHAHNYIDFLTVSTFVGPTVGALHLLDPQQWQGPYLQENLMVQGKLYEIVQAKDGYYIVPGRGVTLANGKVIGKDIIFTQATDVTALINPTMGLEYNNKPLAARIETRSKTLAAIVETNDFDGYEE